MADERAANPERTAARAARLLVKPFLSEISALHDEAAALMALHSRSMSTDGREVLQRAVAAQAALTRIERQLGATLVGEPIEIAENGRIRDCRGAIASIRSRLASLGA